MERRSFLSAAGAIGAAAASGALFERWREITPQVHAPGMDEGHFLRDRRALPEPSDTIETDVLILGSGIAGLSAAWQLGRAGHRAALMLDGPQSFGNAAGGSYGEYAYPTGAHYLPVPALEAVHVRELLADLGILQSGVRSEKPYYDERALLHGPQERLLYRGRWQEGLLPTEGVPADELAEQRRFFGEIAQLRRAVGADGRRAFVLPTALASSDPAFAAFDALTLKQWVTQRGYRAPTLHWYLDYCCRDDYGAGYDQVSAWAGLHYFCSRGGEAANAADGAWLTWPGGLSVLAAKMAQRSGIARRPGTAVSVRPTDAGVEALCFTLDGGTPRSFVVKARRAICAMPLHVAARVVEDMPGFDAKVHMPASAPWLVTNFLMRGFPRELPEAPLSWDNVVVGQPGLGYVVSTHQDIRATPPEKTVFTAYVALAERSPQEARRWLKEATPQQLLDVAARDLRAAYGWRLDLNVERVDITLRGHAMAIPLPGFRSNAGLAALRALDGPILFAHSDLSGFSVFEEAAYWGVAAADKALA